MHLENNKQSKRVDVQLELSTDGLDDDLVETILSSGNVTKLSQDGKDVTREYLGVKYQSISQLYKSTCWLETRGDKKEPITACRPKPRAAKSSDMTTPHTKPSASARPISRTDISKFLKSLQEQQASYSKALQRNQALFASYKEALLKFQEQQALFVQALQNSFGQRDVLGNRHSHQALQDIFGQRNVFGNSYSHDAAGRHSLGTLHPAGRHSHSIMHSGIPSEIDS